MRVDAAVVRVRYLTVGGVGRRARRPRNPRTAIFQNGRNLVRKQRELRFILLSILFELAFHPNSW